MIDGFRIPAGRQVATENGVQAAEQWVGMNLENLVIVLPSAVGLLLICAIAWRAGVRHGENKRLVQGFWAFERGRSLGRREERERLNKASRWDF
jgi:hypothetical protein